MSKSQFIIPKKLKVGFDERDDTYTGRLAYVIYYDDKGVLRKEKGWNNWRDEKIEPLDIDNEPTEGFVLNKKVGGYKSDWNFRQAYTRVYDPRNFEFEITIENLIYILAQCGCTPGKGLEGKFVYAWHGTSLVLLPEGSEDYKNSVNYTKLQSQKISKEELVPGASYETKRQVILTYIGKLKVYNPTIGLSYHDGYKSPKVGDKPYVFWDEKTFVLYKDLKDIAKVNSEVIHSDYASILDRFNKSAMGSKAVRLFTKPVEVKRRGGSYYEDTSNTWCLYKGDETYQLCYSVYERDNSKPYNYENTVFFEEPYRSNLCRTVSIKDNQLIFSDDPNTYSYRLPDRRITAKKEDERERSYRSWYNYSTKHNCNILDDYVAPTNMELWCELESGSTFKVGNGYLEEPKEQQNDE